MSRLSGRTYTFAWTPGSVASNAQATLNIAIPDARLGDMIFVTADSALSHLVLQGHVEANDGSADVHLQNSTGGPIDIGSTVLNVLHVRKGAFFGG